MFFKQYRRDVDSVFSLLGNSENAITTSMAWTLAQCPAFCNSLLRNLFNDLPEGDPSVATQSYGKDCGFTDIEIFSKGQFHVIIEAKRGWWLPSEDQLKKYARRLCGYPAAEAQKLLVTMSECSQQYARSHLGPTILGYRVCHRSWRNALKIVSDSRRKTRRRGEKLWLGQLQLFLEGISSTQNQYSNEVFVVSLGASEIKRGSGYAWIDVVERDRRYFHPVGNGWPAEPPNYIGFRYYGKLQSVHHVSGYKVVDNLLKENTSWPKTSRDRFVYKLGKPMKPHRDVRTGKIFRNGRVWCFIDTLLSGQYKTISDARDASKTRLERQRRQASD